MVLLASYQWMMKEMMEVHYSMVKTEFYQLYKSNLMLVKNLHSSKGNVIPNQFEIRTKHAVYFQSYNSIIAKIEKGTTYLDERYWNYSRTTAKYRNMFLGEGKAITESKILAGEYILTDLNKEPIDERRGSNFKFLN